MEYTEQQYSFSFFNPWSKQITVDTGVDSDWISKETSEG